MACRHLRLSATQTFVPNSAHSERMYQVEVHCADCGAPVEFIASPTLTLDNRTLQIPFRIGAPNPVNLIPRPVGPMLIGGARKGMN